jgi:hypothetical protein
MRLMVRTFCCVISLLSLPAFSAMAAQVLAPTIVSAVNAEGQINAPFTYTCLATGGDPIVFSASGLPEGLAISADKITGTPTEFGTFLVTLTATNLVGSDSEMLTFGIQPLAAPDGSLTNVDRDGDGFSDELEIALNSSPTKQSSVPIANVVTAPVGDLTVQRLAFRFNFLRDNRDTLNCRGSIVVGDNALRAGQMFVLDAGGVIQAVALDARGKALETEDNTFAFKLRLPRSGATGVRRVGRFSLSIRRRTLFPKLTDEGFTETASGVYTVPVTVVFDNTQYMATVQQNFTARNGKSGSTR